MKKSGREDAPRAVEVLEFIGFWHQNPIFFIIYGNESDKVKDVPIDTVVSLYVISEDKRSRQARRRALEGVARLRACSAAAEARIFRLRCDICLLCAAHPLLEVLTMLPQATKKWSG